MSIHCIRGKSDAASYAMKLTGSPARQVIVDFKKGYLEIGTRIYTSDLLYSISHKMLGMGISRITFFDKGSVEAFFDNALRHNLNPFLGALNRAKIKKIDFFLNKDCLRLVRKRISFGEEEHQVLVPEELSDAEKISMQGSAVRGDSDFITFIFTQIFLNRGELSMFDQEYEENDGSQEQSNPGKVLKEAKTINLDHKLARIAAFPEGPIRISITKDDGKPAEFTFTPLPEDRKII